MGLSCFHEICLSNASGNKRNPKEVLRRLETYPRWLLAKLLAVVVDLRRFQNAKSQLSSSRGLIVAWRGELGA